MTSRIMRRLSCNPIKRSCSTCTRLALRCAKHSGSQTYMSYPDRNSSGLLAACGGSPWLCVDGRVGGLGPPTLPSTHNGSRSARGAEESRKGLLKSHKSRYYLVLIAKTCNCPWLTFAGSVTLLIVLPACKATSV